MATIEDIDSDQPIFKNVKWYGVRDGKRVESVDGFIWVEKEGSVND